MTTSSTKRIINPARRIFGCARIPGDKSISHRYAMLAALAEGSSFITNYAPGADCHATLSCLRDLGVIIKTSDTEALKNNGTTIRIEGRGSQGLTPPSNILNVGNSGTTIRLLTGILATQSFESALTGDESLTSRPMERVITPLTQMGAHITAHNGRAPLTVTGRPLHAIDYIPDIPSAQVKSAILFAGLQAKGTTTIRERAITRDHSELALEAFGAFIERSNNMSAHNVTNLQGIENTDTTYRVAITGDQRLVAQSLNVPGDLSSAGFLAAAAAALPGSELELIDVGLNPTRTALINVLRRMGVSIEISEQKVLLGERRGNMVIRHNELHPITIKPGEVPALIDELPLLAALATHGGGLNVTGAEELRKKESDRITSLVTGLRNLGANITEQRDGFCVQGDKKISGGQAQSFGDHRIAMALAIAGLGANGSSLILDSDAVEVSYPNFFDDLEAIVE